MSDRIDSLLEDAYNGLIEQGKKKEANILLTAEIHDASEDWFDVDREGLASGGTIYDVAIVYESEEEFNNDVQDYIEKSIYESKKNYDIRNIIWCHRFKNPQKNDPNYPQDIKKWLRDFRNQFRVIIRKYFVKKPYLKEIFNIFTIEKPYLDIFLIENYEKDMFKGFSIRIYEAINEDRIFEYIQKIYYPYFWPKFSKLFPTPMTDEAYLETSMKENENYYTYLASIQNDNILRSNGDSNSEYEGDDPIKEFYLKPPAFKKSLPMIIDDIIKNEEHEFLLKLYNKQSFVNLPTTITSHQNPKLFSALWITNVDNACETLWYDYLQYENALHQENLREVFVKIGGIIEYLMILFGTEKYPSESIFTNNSPKFENMIDYVIKMFNKDPDYFFGNPAAWSNVLSLKIFRNMVHIKKYIDWLQPNTDLKTIYIQYLKNSIEGLLECTKKK